MKIFYVYMYLRSKNSKHGKVDSPYYVGKGKGMRAYSKEHRVRPPKDMTRILFVAKNLSEVEAHQLETLLIYLHGRIDKETGTLRNLTDGGEGQHGAKWDPKIIEKRASKLRGRPRPCFSEQWKANLSASHLGMKASQETRTKMSQMRQGKSLRKGFKHSAETRAKVSAANRARWAAKKLIS
jgi:hypothetical protein